MTDRIHCSINGCGCTRKRYADKNPHGWMCAKHWRAAGAALPEIKRYYMRCRRLYRNLRKRYPWMWDPKTRAEYRALGPQTLGHQAEKRATKLITFVWNRMRRWDGLLRAEAQRQQDAGFFDRGRRRPAKRPPQDPSNTSPLAGRFEDQFQRLKKAMKC